MSWLMRFAAIEIAHAITSFISVPLHSDSERSISTDVGTGLNSKMIFNVVDSREAEGHKEIERGSFLISDQGLKGFVSSNPQETLQIEGFAEGAFVKFLFTSNFKRFWTENEDGTQIERNVPKGTQGRVTKKYKSVFTGTWKYHVAVEDEYGDLSFDVTDLSANDIAPLNQSDVKTYIVHVKLDKTQIIFTNDNSHLSFFHLYGDGKERLYQVDLKNGHFVNLIGTFSSPILPGSQSHCGFFMKFCSSLLFQDTENKDVNAQMKGDLEDEDDNKCTMAIRCIMRVDPQTNQRQLLMTSSKN